MSANIGINGFGRIGRQILRIIAEENLDINIAAVNGRSDLETYKHLLKYDSAYGKIKVNVDNDKDFLRNCCIYQYSTENDQYSTSNLVQAI